MKVGRWVEVGVVDPGGIQLPKLRYLELFSSVTSTHVLTEMKQHENTC